MVDFRAHSHDYNSQMSPSVLHFIAHSLTAQMYGIQEQIMVFAYMCSKCSYNWILTQIGEMPQLAVKKPVTALILIR
jgi:hypothetical protein